MRFVVGFKLDYRREKADDVINHPKEQRGGGRSYQDGKAPCKRILLKGGISKRGKGGMMLFGRVKREKEMGGIETAKR